MLLFFKSVHIYRGVVCAHLVITADSIVLIFTSLLSAFMLEKMDEQTGDAVFCPDFY